MVWGVGIAARTIKDVEKKVVWGVGVAGGLATGVKELLFPHRDPPAPPVW